MGGGGRTQWLEMVRQEMGRPWQAGDWVARLPFDWGPFRRPSVKIIRRWAIVWGAIGALRRNMHPNPNKAIDRRAQLDRMRARVEGQK